MTMSLKLNIKTFRSEIDTRLRRKGESYFSEGRIRKLIYNARGNVRAVVHGTINYSIEMSIDNDTGDIDDVSCSCPAAEKGLCKHAVAVMYACADKFKEHSSEGKSSRIVLDLIQKKSTAPAPEVHKDAFIRVIPHIIIEDNIPFYYLTVGSTRMYKVRNIFDLYHIFRYGMHLYCGKELDMQVDMDMLTDDSRRLLELCAMQYMQSPGYERDDKKIKLSDIYIDDVLSLCGSDTIDADGTDVAVIHQDPKISLSIKANGDDFELITEEDCMIMFGTSSAHVYKPKERKWYISSRRFMQEMKGISPIFSARELRIARADMASFYSVVLKRISKYAETEGIELIADLIPPDMSPQLYVDVDRTGNIVGQLVFTYGENMINYDPAEKPAPPRDIIGERAAVALVKNFMMENNDKAHPFICDDDELVYLFLTEGSKQLMNEMEVFASDRFLRMSVRPPVKPVIGVRPDGDLLSLDISDDNYTQAELLEVLSAYRQGAKYHRMKDGTFALITDALSGFDELAANLNITDRQFLKDHISIPKYRMMYLEQLRSAGSVRLRSSDSFRSMVREYHAQLENTDLSGVPDNINGTMRDYQQHGFHWMKTISSYGFGGILADDMGLGKTIQAIAFMLDARAAGKKPFLVVCPSSLTLNWLSEIHRFAPSLDAVVIAGTAPARSTLIDSIAEHDVAITSYASITRDIDKYEGMHFAVEFIDEAQYIKNHSTQAAKAVKGIDSDVRFALTGTPVENSLAELWSIFDYIMPDYLFSYTRFKKTYETPIVLKGDKHAVKALQRTVSPFILRRMKKDVLTELPDKTETVLVSEMESEQRKLYTALVMQTKKMLRDQSVREDRIKILAMLMRMRQICCDPSLIYEDYKGGSAKLQQCLDLIESCVNSGHKLLLFSQFTSMLDIIDRALDGMGISRYMLTGSTKASERLRMVNAFNSDDTKVFLISLKAGGTGLNLTGADIVIHYDPWWNLSAEEQASDRVYRIGQKNNVQIYKLISDRSIEQNILRLQQQKAALSDMAMGGEQDIMRMSAEEIISILE